MKSEREVLIDAINILKKQLMDRRVPIGKVSSIKNAIAYMAKICIDIETGPVEKE